MTLQENLRKIPNVIFHENIALTEFSTLGLRANGDLLIVQNQNVLSDVVQIIKRHKYSYKVIGSGANIIFSKSMQARRIYIILDFPQPDLLPQEKYVLPASLQLSSLLAHSIRYNIGGWAWMAGIPGTLGGAVIMNAGTCEGEISDVVKEIKVLNGKGDIRRIAVSKNMFHYRGNNFIQEDDIIVEVTITHRGYDLDLRNKIKNILLQRKNKQPIGKKTCGSVFKNYADKKTCLAGKCIDIIGMKGFSVNDLSISKCHGNFFVNNGEAEETDYWQVHEIIKQELELNFGVRFEEEVRHI